MGASIERFKRIFMKYKYVSLFTGAGGLDLGLEQSGLHCLAANEIEKVFCETLEANQGWKHNDGITYLKGTKIINSDIRNISSKDLYNETAELDLVVGGPPCQAFSSSGKQLSVLDPRGALLREFYRIIDELKPKMFLFENVRGIVTARDRNGEPGGVITKLIHILESIGYSCRAGLLNSADFGSFQRRVRCFIVGSKRGLAPEFSVSTHHRGIASVGEPWNSLGSFLSKYADKNSSNFTYPSSQLAKDLKNIPNGSGIKSPGKAEATRPGGHWGYRQGTFIANLDLPARTVTGSASQDWVRWEGILRRLTFNEIKQLQGFPEDWIVKGSKSQQYKQIGNAVPAVFGNLLGKCILNHLRNFPKIAAVKIPIPVNFTGAINYTKRDHERNKASRTVHLQFENQTLPAEIGSE